MATPKITRESLARDKERRYKERLEIARQCEGAAEEVADKFPIAARILMSEAERWRR